MKDGLQKLSELSAMSWRGTWNYLQRATALSTLLGLGAIIQGSVSLLFSFLSHYFAALSEHFLRKELSQIFAPISGGGTWNYLKGGAIYAESSDVKIYTSTFESNTAITVRVSAAAIWLFFDPSLILLWAF
jgi:hypothetical protein